MSYRDFALPSLSLRFFPIWQRHWLVWKKIAAPSILGHLADPVIYMLGLGYGLGSLLPEMGGMSYMAFLAAGTVCYSTMNSAPGRPSSTHRLHLMMLYFPRCCGLPPKA